MINIICIVNGYLEENCYIIHNNKEALIVDPGSEEDKIFKKINDLNLKVIGILVTHYHFDHVKVLDKVKEKYKIKVYDYNNIGNNKINDFEFEIIENYGHTLDSVSFYFKSNKIMFTGDFVFKETIGNYDIINEKTMYESLKKFSRLNKDIIIYPGHGMSSTIGHELENNPFIRSV